MTPAAIQSVTYSFPRTGLVVAQIDHPIPLRVLRRVAANGWRVTATLVDGRTLEVGA